MANRRSKRTRPTQSSRRSGYAAALVVNLFLLVALNFWPGWDALPFLTSHTDQVMGWVNAALVVSVIANVVYIAGDPLWLKAVGDGVTTAVGLLAIVKVWQVFPFHFDSESLKILAQVLLGVAAVGSVLGIIGAFARLVRSLGSSGAGGGRT